ncbi:MAG: hypothetical protein B7O98_00220 [Zestosphaera tikiterensis]|uniref:Na+/H+ antiporter MnhB subunit-related protein domain-containing protein n=1 Tax=Zestosphaera tikiterensis TaxID=1973259 RepID=A0A2R7Y8M5_9CREN|nr:MAG: hypothetical protein B7O98_00220 [Zestosphaera tikiterensis]
MRLGRYLQAFSLVALAVLLAVALTYKGLGDLPNPAVRDLALWYLYTTLNPEVPNMTVMSPEAVTAIVWDYRGLDTLFETMVFFLAIVGALAIMRGITLNEGGEGLHIERYGLSLITKTATKLLVPLIIGVSASIALHGHLTPGGGFQGGSAAAVAPLLVLVIFSTYYVVFKLRLSELSMISLRTLGLMGIYMTSFATLILGLVIGVNAYIFQNMPKANAFIGLPPALGGSLISGTLFFFNLFEFFAVAAGFTLVFILLSIPEVKAREVLKGEEHGH